MKRKLLATALEIFMLFGLILYFPSETRFSPEQRNTIKVEATEGYISPMSNNAEVHTLQIDESLRSSPYEDIEYVDETEFEVIWNAYDSVDITSAFNLGSVKEYNYYLQQYNKFLKGESTFWDKESQVEMYITEYDEFKLNAQVDGGFDLDKYVYYLFDMDDDGAPELGISDNERFTYIFKYHADSDRFSLWFATKTMWNYLMGSRKIG